ncbi:MAG: creatininase family protein [Clostridiaceae bacterium]|jgi:creatinine amidohydrolase|nr:creatininase family protein [Clostridiaceae bacterium]
MLTYYSTREDIENSGVDTVVLPIGSIEQHGPHLPIGTDFLIGNKIGEAVSKRIRALLLPTLPISTCREHKGCRGNVWINSDTLYHALRDITESLKSQGFRRIILIIAHGGIFISGPATREINSDNEEIKIIRVDLLNFLPHIQKEGILESDNNLHACEYETSLMMYLYDDLVRKDKIEDCIPEIPRDYLNYTTIPKACKNGVWGRPSLANAEKGERIFDILIEKCVEYISDVNRVLDKTD